MFCLVHQNYKRRNKNLEILWFEIIIFDPFQINGLARRFPGLMTLRSVDLSPASWMAVSWYYSTLFSLFVEYCFFVKRMNNFLIICDHFLGTQFIIFPWEELSRICPLASSLITLYHLHFKVTLFFSPLYMLCFYFNKFTKLLK